MEIELNGSKTTIEKLQMMIEERQRIIGETSNQSLAATAINILISLRADTKVAKKAKDIKVEDTGYYAGWKAKRRVIRTGKKQNDSRVSLDNYAIYYQHGLLSQKESKVFKITPENSRVKPYYYVCRNKAEAIAHERERAKKRIDRYAYLAKNTLSVAMHKVSKKSQTIYNGNSVQKEKVSKLADVNMNVTGSKTYLTVIDNTNYAVLALKSGQSGIEKAIQRACNKTAGLLSKIAEKKLGQKVETPFKDI